MGYNDNRDQNTGGRRDGGNRARSRDERGGYNKKKNIEELERDFKIQLAKELQTEDYVTFFLNSDKQKLSQYIDGIKSFVKSVGDNISTSQLRNVFPAIKTETDYQQLARLRPQLAYISGKADKDEQRKLIYLLDQMIVNITSADQLKAFQYFFEAIIAYHKYYGGKS